MAQDEMQVPRRKCIRRCVSMDEWNTETCSLGKVVTSSGDVIDDVTGDVIDVVSSSFSVE